MTDSRTTATELGMKNASFTELDCLKTLFHNSTKIIRQKPVRTYYILKMIPYYIIKDKL